MQKIKGKCRPIRSVRIADKRWANIQAKCRVSPGASASVTFRKIFKLVEDYKTLYWEADRLRKENQKLKETLRSMGYQI